MAHTTFRKRGEKRVTVISGAELAKQSETSQANMSMTNPRELDRIRKGMTVSEVERILGHGDYDPMSMTGMYAVVNYRDKNNGIAVVYRDNRVISRAFIQ
jgi:hypothetical protein